MFGLGFDTATEVALFGIAATQAASGAVFGSLLVFPALFAAGMTFIDTTDGVLMLGAYGWVFMKPIPLAKLRASFEALLRTAEGAPG